MQHHDNTIFQKLVLFYHDHDYDGDSEADRVWNSQQWKQCRKLVMKDQRRPKVTMMKTDSDGEAEEDEFDDLEETLELMPGVNQK